jgi:hypothetical protein
MSRRMMLRHSRRVAGTLLLLVAPFADGVAQGEPPRTRQTSGTQPPGERRGGREMEEQVQRRIMAIMKERLALTEEQLTQLAEVTRQFDRERMSVRGEDYRMRITLRRELAKGDSASQDRIAEMLDRMPAVERRRIDLMEREQRELARFLSPLQRARYVALQEEIRRGMEQIRERRDSSDGPSRRDGRPPEGRPPVRP